MEMKQNLIFYHAKYSNLTPYLIKKKSSISMRTLIFQFCMAKMNPNNGNETKSDIFPWNIFKPDIPFFIKKY